MKTKNIVPRADNEGSLGTALKRWEKVHAAVMQTTHLSSSDFSTKNLTAESIKTAHIITPEITHLQSKYWQSNEQVELGYIRYPNNMPGHNILLVCTQAGTTAMTEQLWPTVEVTVKDGTAKWHIQTITNASLNKYNLCEFYDFRHPTLKEGFVVRNGGLYEEADVNYPQAWEYLQTEAGQLLCVTESEWQAYSSTAGGIGGVPWFVIDTEEKTIRVPDTRGDFSRSEGFGGQNTGDWQGDAIRNIVGTVALLGQANGGNGIFSGALYMDTGGNPASASGTNVYVPRSLYFDASRSAGVKVAQENRPRNYAVLSCVYLGGAA